MTDIGTLGGKNSAAYSINSNGQVAGASALTTSSSRTYAFLYSNGHMANLGSFGGWYCEGISVSNAGQVAGYGSTNNAVVYAFLYSDGGVNVIATLGGSYPQVNGMNDAGEIVGFATIGSFDRAFLYNGSGLVDLNTLIDPTSGWFLADATAINDSGQIVGFGGYAGHPEAFLLTPIPEPATLGLMAIGLTGMFLRRRRAATSPR